MIRTSPTVGDNSGNGQLRAFVERILRLKEEQDTIASDIREIYAEAKGTGFDKTAMGQLVAHLRKVDKVGAPAVEEGQTVFDLYLDAYQRATGTPLATHTHEAKSLDPKLVETIAKAVQTEAGTAALLAAVDIMIEREEAADDIPHSPEPEPLQEQAKPEAPVTAAPLSHPKGETASGEISDADVPAFLKKDERKQLRPNCLNPDLCAGVGRNHCGACKKAMAESEIA